MSNLSLFVNMSTWGIRGVLSNQGAWFAVSRPFCAFGAGVAERHL